MGIYRTVVIFVCVLLAGCAARNYSGFVGVTEGLMPISQGYAETRPEIVVPNAGIATMIIYSHGTENSWRKEKCGESYVKPPPYATFLLQEADTHVFYLCSEVTDTNYSDARYIFGRSAEITGLADELLAAGVQPRNIFLMGHSAGGWSSLMAMQHVGKKFNAAIVTAPACCTTRADPRGYRKRNRPSQEKAMLRAERIEALVFAYHDDVYNRPQDLTFLTDRYPETVKMVGYHCGHGHGTYRNDCRFRQTKNAILQYITARKQDFDAKANGG